MFSFALYFHTYSFFKRAPNFYMPIYCSLELCFNCFEFGKGTNEIVFDYNLYASLCLNIQRSERQTYGDLSYFF